VSHRGLVEDEAEALNSMAQSTEDLVVEGIEQGESYRDWVGKGT